MSSRRHTCDRPFQIAARALSLRGGFFRSDWDAIGRKLAAQYGATFVPGGTCYSPSHTGPDRLHMSAEGHTVVAQRLAPVVAGALGGRKAQPAKRAAAKRVSRRP